MNLGKLVDKYQLALEEAQKNRPQGGCCGFELEWNLLDEELQPLMRLGSAAERQSFVDYLRSEHLPAWARDFSQLEVFHWMVEWATRPYYSPVAAVFEARLLEAVQLNALQRAGQAMGARLYAWHGNLLTLTPIGHDSIPDSWHIAKRRYLERCVDLYGESLATAGTHSNLSLPDPLFTWDYLLLSPSEREGQHLDEFKSQFYITATRLMRAFCPLFIALSASTPLQAQPGPNGTRVRLTDTDSVRSLTFPNPAALDVPDLYRSYQDYLRLSYDLVRRGIRFGNNNWTPVRARSFAEPVERLIDLTSEQLQDLYVQGWFSAREDLSMEEIARQVEIQNLMARIHLPMARLEVRTDDGGHALEVDIANATFKHLLLVLIYGDSEFARAFRYDREDIARARRNEEAAARRGLEAGLENPLTGKPASLREFLAWTLEQVRPLAQALECAQALEPLFAMASGETNTAGKLRRLLHDHYRMNEDVPPELLLALAEERQAAVRREVEQIAGEYATIRMAGVRLESDARRLGELLEQARSAAVLDASPAVQFTPASISLELADLKLLEPAQPDAAAEILALTQALIRIPSVSTGGHERLDDIFRAAAFINQYAVEAGLSVRIFDQDRYPALWITFPPIGEPDIGPKALPEVVLGGHFDVVPPDPDERQFEPRLEGDYLWGRGAADMKTVVATYLVWMKNTLKRGQRSPPIGLLLVGNEENGEVEAAGTPHVLDQLNQGSLELLGKSYAPRLFIAGERTGERGDEMWGEICTQNRGVMRFDVTVQGKRGHSSTGSQSSDMSEKLISARQGLVDILERCLTLQDLQGWKSQYSFPFMKLGEAGNYNVTPGHGLLGVEVRSIPQDDLARLEAELRKVCAAQGLELSVSVREKGITCDPHNPLLAKLIRAVQQSSGTEPGIGRKLAGTSARFAPGEQGVVWGQTGIGPHAADERHYIPSILPYYRALERFAELLLEE